MDRFFAACCVLLLAPAAVPAEEKFFLRDGERVVFLGDSNTFAGLYIAYLDAYLYTRFPGQKFELLNLGLPSETVSGLSEPDHPFPRPHVHERLDRALEKTKPDVVIACYGMNDGIYYPFNEEHFQKYQQGTRKLLERVNKSGARIMLMTTPPFDPVPVQGKLLPKSAPKFSWMTPYQGYDEVLKRYSEWWLTLREKNIPVADAHTAVNRYLAEARKADPKYRLASDGIHPNPTGHWLIAEQLLQAWNAPAEVDGAVINTSPMKVLKGEVKNLTGKEGEIRFTWETRLPMPADPRWEQQLAEKGKIAERFNRHRLTVMDAPQARYELYEGEQRLGVVSKAELAAGVNLLRFSELSTNRRSSELWKLVEQRQRVLGRAWLSEVGHKRPNTPKGLPLKEALQQAGELEKQIRQLAQPMKLSLRLAPVEK